MRQVLRRLISLPIEDHPAMADGRDVEHHCIARALDLVTYIKALRKACLFPFPGDGEELCLLWLGQQLHAIATKISPTEGCLECGFEGGHWRVKLDAISKTLHALLRSSMEAVDSYVEVFED